MKKLLLLAILALSSCNPPSDDDDLRTTPVTNNPHIVPSHGSGLPMMGGAN